MYLPLPVILVLSLPLMYLLNWVFKPVIDSFRNRPATEYKHEYNDPDSKDDYPMKQFPSLFTKSSLYLSVIIPAYNEESRFDEMMLETMAYFLDRRAQNPKFQFEVIIVDDGSKDRTAEVVMAYVRKYGAETVRLLRLKRNQGKGGAVQQGMLNARGQYLLMADADGATRVADFARLEDALCDIETEDGVGVALGSRAHIEDEAVAKRSYLRNVLMHGFHFLVSHMCVHNVRDTQCGFKLFTRRAAQYLFPNQRIRRWCFDVELLHLAQRLHIPLVEVPVNWTEIPGSKLQVLEASLMMGRDIVIIRLCYMLGVWRINFLPSQQDPRKQAQRRHKAM